MKLYLTLIIIATLMSISISDATEYALTINRNHVPIRAPEKVVLDFTIINKTSDMINGIWINENKKHFWSKNLISIGVPSGASVKIAYTTNLRDLYVFDMLLSNSSVIPHAITIITKKEGLPPTESSPYVNLFPTKMYDESINLYSKNNVNLTSGSEFTFTNGDLGCEYFYSFTIQNDTGTDIEGVWVTNWYNVWLDKINKTTLYDGQSIKISAVRQISDDLAPLDIMLRTASKKNEGDVYVKLYQLIKDNSTVIFTNNDLVSVIKGPAGGYIFYDKGEYSDGWRYLEAAPEDDEPAMWSESRVVVSGTSETIGSGKENTMLIVTALNKLRETGTAAQICDAKTINGYSDWFLPSKDELNLMYDNLHRMGMGDFKRSLYLSSSQSGESNAWIQSFSITDQSEASKDSKYFIRAIRSF